MAECVTALDLRDVAFKLPLEVDTMTVTQLGHFSTQVQLAHFCLILPSSNSSCLFFKKNASCLLRDILISFISSRTMFCQFCSHFLISSTYSFLLAAFLYPKHAQVSPIEKKIFSLLMTLSPLHCPALRINLNFSLPFAPQSSAVWCFLWQGYFWPSFHWIQHFPVLIVLFHCF